MMLRMRRAPPLLRNSKYCSAGDVLDARQARDRRYLAAAGRAQ
jgi:hypothetical protein